MHKPAIMNATPSHDLTTDLTTDSQLASLESTAPIHQKLSDIEAYLDAAAEVKHFSGAVLILQSADATSPTESPSPIIRTYGLANQEHQVAIAPETKFRIGSVTKQFTAAAILQLQEKKLLDLQVPISEYLPDYPQGDRITIHHLLTHTAGIPEYLNPEAFPDLQEWLRQTSTLEQIVARIQAVPLNFEPGEKFNYSNSGYILLTQIIEFVSGESYADYLQTHFFDPLALANTGYETPPFVIPQLAQGYLFMGNDTYLHSQPLDMSLPQGAGGLYSTVADLAQWTQWLHSNTESDVLSADARKRLMQPAVLMEPDTRPELFYGYGIVIDTHLERSRTHHSGGISGFASTLARYPDESLTIAVLSNLETATPSQIAEDIAAIAFDKPYQLPKLQAAIDLDPALYEKYIGTYQLLPEMQVAINVVDGQLTAQATGQESFVLYPTSEVNFFATVAEIEVTFSLSDSKEVEGLTLRQLGRDLFAPKIEQ